MVWYLTSHNHLLIHLIIWVIPMIGHHKFRAIFLIFNIRASFYGESFVSFEVLWDGSHHRIDWLLLICVQILARFVVVWGLSIFCSTFIVIWEDVILKDRIKHRHFGGVAQNELLWYRNCAFLVNSLLSNCCRGFGGIILIMMVFTCVIKFLVLFWHQRRRL